MHPSADASVWNSGGTRSIVRDIAAMGALAPDFCSKADQLRFIQVYLDTPSLGEEDRRRAFPAPCRSSRPISANRRCSGWPRVPCLTCRSWRRPAGVGNGRPAA